MWWSVKRSIVRAVKVRVHRVVHTSKMARERKRIVNNAGVFYVYSISESQLYGAWISAENRIQSSFV